MNTRIVFRSLAAALLSLIPASPALAQDNPPPQPVSQLGGPLVPAVCLISREAIVANAAVGQAANARLQELGRVVQAEIDSQRQPLEAELRTLEQQASAPDFEQRRTALATRWQTLERQAQHGNREIDATRAKVLGQIANEAQPVIAQVYGQRSCGLLLDRSVVLGGNFGNDLTGDVVKALDAKIRTIAFEREKLPEEASAAGGR